MVKVSPCLFLFHSERERERDNVERSIEKCLFSFRVFRGQRWDVIRTPDAGTWPELRPQDDGEEDVTSRNMPGLLHSWCTFDVVV